MTKTMSFLALLLAGFGIVVTKVPHMRLAAQLASGELDGRQVPVTDFVPARFDESAVSVRLGKLAFDVPLRARVEPASSDESSGIRLELDGLKCRILPPRHGFDVYGPGPRKSHATLGRDEIAREAFICGASGNDLSLWMNAAEARELQERLEAKPLYCLSADRVEVVRRETLSGLLLSSTIEGLPRMIFAYVSVDNRLRGRVFLFADVGSTEAVEAARALVSTFRIEG